jgi:hypothetical protein
VKTAIDRAAEAIEASETMFADEMGATLDLSSAARMALLGKIAAAIRTAVAEEQKKLELSDEEAVALLDLLDQAIGCGIPPSPRMRTLRAIRAKLQSILPQSSTLRTANAQAA